VNSVNSNIECPDPLEMLIAEHQKDLELLDGIEKELESIQANGFTAEAFKHVADSLRQVGKEIHRHCDMEERHLFPLLEKHLFESPNIIRYERREMWHTFNRLMDFVKDVEDGKIHGTTIREFIQMTKNVVLCFRSHNQKEETILFPMVKRLLTIREYKELQKNFGTFV